MIQIWKEVSVVCVKKPNSQISGGSSKPVPHEQTSHPEFYCTSVETLPVAIFLSLVV
jgi:hypothetical protein